MKRFLLTAVFVLIGTLAFSQERLAVFPFEDTDDVLTTREQAQFYSEFTTEFANKSAGRYSVVPRQDVERLVNIEADFQLTDFSAKNKTADMQRVLNGTRILSGRIGKVGSNIRVAVSVYSYPEIQLLYGDTLSVYNKNELFNRIPELVQKIQDKIPNPPIIPGGNEDADGRPGWIRIPLNGRVKFETGNSGGVSAWYYDFGQSNKTSTEQLARTRARENVQQMVAANIATNIRGRIDITENSMFNSSDHEDVKKRIVTALTNTISTKVPSYELLEWHIEKGNENGKNYFEAFVLVRFNRQDIIKNVENLNMQAVADNIIRNMGISATNSERAALIRELEAARDIEIVPIRNGSGGR